MRGSAWIGRGPAPSAVLPESCHGRYTARERRRHWSAARSGEQPPPPARAASPMRPRTILRSARNFPPCQVAAESSSQCLGELRPYRGGLWLWGDGAARQRWRGAPGRAAARPGPIPGYRPPCGGSGSRTPMGAVVAAERAVRSGSPAAMVMGHRLSLAQPPSQLAWCPRATLKLAQGSRRQTALVSGVRNSVSGLLSPALGHRPEH